MDVIEHDLGVEPLCVLHEALHQFWALNAMDACRPVGKRRGGHQLRPHPATLASTNGGIFTAAAESRWCGRSLQPRRRDQTQVPRTTWFAD